MARSIFFLGDLHLGRRPTGLTEVLAGFGLEARALSPAAVLEATVTRALSERPRALIFAGDLIDDEDDRFEAFAPLTTAVATLRAAGIAVFAVAGNHDVLALPPLCRRIEGLTLLGEGGRWELAELPGEGPDDPPVDLLGWSFSDRHVHDDPTRSPELNRVLQKRRPGARLLGVIHGDLDRPGSSYAPLDGEALRATGADAFLLGHVHAPSALEAPDPSPPLGYLGSVAALDPGEPGAHGPWRLTFEPEARLRQLPLSPTRFERLPVELDDAAAASPESILEAITVATTEHLPDCGEASLLCLRVELRGRLQDRSAVSALLQRSLAERGLHHPAGLPTVVETLIDRTRPAIDLLRLCEQPTPVGQLARRIQALEAGESEAASELLTAAHQAAKPWTEGRWAGAPGEALDASLEERLLAAAWSALDRLLEQGRPGGTG